ncbi:helix-turn-helix transcriptional regulator [uncultured Methanobrevibacter sp.]|uniref:helix-turn-helix domain-containing protein n=1 Tax=uncultured Methanobrevibacter sp. TaxID=253161 RepID=UPI00260FE3CC|nr:helix-turn-helix transcriptional regulator [uncultured Methanobrevibacter sp.]
MKGRKKAMTTEEKLKQFILTKHRSVLEFTQSIGMPYGTMSSIFKRGIENSSVTNIIKICSALGISTDELAKGNIVPVEKADSTAIEDIFQYAKQKLLSAKNPTLDGIPLHPDIIMSIVDGLDLLIEIQKKKDDVK